MKKKFFVFSAIIIVLVSVSTVTLYSFVSPFMLLPYEIAWIDCVGHCSTNSDSNSITFCVSSCMYGKGY